MNCWEILGLEPTSDKKAIKKAYASLLKSNKPDENPQGFAQLHAAYKQSLQHAATMADDYTEALPPIRESLHEPQQHGYTASLSDSDDTYQPHIGNTETLATEDGEQTLDSTTITAEDLEPTHSPEDGLNDRMVIQAEDYESEAGIIEKNIAQDDDIINKEDQEHISSLQSAWERLESDAGNALEKLQLGDNSKDWDFLESYDELYDIEFKQEFSYALFEQLILFFEENDIATTNRKKALQCLNSLFHWNEQNNHLAYRYGEERIANIINAIDQVEYNQETKLQWVTDKYHQGPIEHASYYARIAAVAVDILLIYVIFGSSIFSALFPEHDSNSVLYALLFYMVVVPIIEASPMQGSPGKILFGLKVTTKNGRRLSMLHSAWRQIMYLASTAGFKLTIWINIFTYDGRLLHDRFSNSLVIKR